MRTKTRVGAGLLAGSLLFASTAAGAGPGAGTQAAPAPRHTFRLFDKTWCVGDVSPAVACDVRIGAGGTQTSQASAKVDATSADPLDALRRLVRPGATSLALTPLEKVLHLQEKLGHRSAQGGTDATP